MQHQAAHHGCPHPPSKAKLGESTGRSILPCMVGSVAKGRRVGFFCCDDSPMPSNWTTKIVCYSSLHVVPFF